MQFHQIRNATVKITYAGTTFLIDPYLGEKHAYEGYEGTINNHLRSPTVALSTPMNEILKADAVIVTHAHPDHWDKAAIRLVPKNMPLFAQHQQDADLFRSQGFTDVRLLDGKAEFKGVELIQTDGIHGPDSLMEIAGDLLGEVSGVVFKHPSEKTLYIAGDTIWHDTVAKALRTHTPDVVVLNAGDAQVPGFGSIIMNTEHVKAVYDAAPQAVLIASHMEAINQCVLSRAELRAFLDDNQMTDRVLVPDDNERYTFS